MKDLAKEFGCHAKTIRNWVKQDDPKIHHSRPQTQSLSEAERQELIALRKELKRVRIERDILAKATAWFAHNRTTNPSFIG